jgi:nucleotide-binding universal stress UspA family protein
MFRHILIPTDGTALSESAIRAGVDMARALGARVTGFFAAPAPTPLVYGDLLPVGYMPPDQHEALIRKASEHHLGVIESMARGASVPVKCVSVTSDYPADSIIKVASEEGCDLIFMASHGRRGLSGILLGSETHKVLTHAKVPVLVYR